MAVNRGRLTLEWAKENGILDEFIKIHQEHILPFKEARKIARSLGFKSRTEYHQVWKDGKLPKGMPGTPHYNYKDSGWDSWYDFLGKEKPANFLPFKEARKIARSLGIKGRTEYQQAYKEDKLPKGMPCAPDKIYEGKGWIDFYDFLGKEKPANFLPFDEACKIVRSLGIKKSKEYLKFHKEDKLPKGMPSTPDKAYKDKGWIDWYDFFGKEKPANFLSFKEARKIVRSLGIKGEAEYRQAYKEDKLPKGMPSTPDKVYEGKGWIDFYDFFGKENPVMILPFDEACKIVRSLGIKGEAEYKMFRKEGKLPKGMPKNPHYNYKDSGWDSWYDFLGKEKPLPFKEARKIARSLGVKSQLEYFKVRKEGKLPKGMPSTPSRQYKEWNGWYDFLGNEKPAFLPFDEACKIVRSLGIKSNAEYQQAYKEDKLPKGMPSTPDKAYKDKGWIDWYDFLGKEKPAFLPFKEARKIARSLGIKSQPEYRQVWKDGKLPKGMPGTPYYNYKDSGWDGWYDFLCKEKPAFLPFDEARKIARSLGIKSVVEYKTFRNEGKLPKGMPCAPDKAYKDKGWIDWYDFLGKDKK